MDVPFADTVPGYAGVVAQVPLQDVADPQLCPVVEHADTVWDLDRFILLVPEDLGGGSPASL